MNITTYGGEKKGSFDLSKVERAIKVPPENLAYRLDPQERDDILMHDELRELAKNAVIIGVIALMASVV